MNIKLKPIAESKVRQLGGDVCGVLVRTEDGVMAVSEHGRCTRLDAGVMGPVEPACISDMRDEFEKRFPVPEGVEWSDEIQKYVAIGGVAYNVANHWNIRFEAWQAASSQSGQGAEPVVAYRYRVIGDPQGWEYSSEPLFGPESGPGPKEEYQALTLDQLLSELNDTQPQPAVPEGWKLVPAEITAGQLKAAWDEMALYLDEVSPVYDLLLKSAPQPPAGREGA